MTKSAPPTPPRRDRSAPPAASPRVAGKPSRRKVPAVKPGDLVMCGSYGISMPGDFFLARALWTDGVENALAVGTIKELGEFRERAHQRVAKLRREVDAAERKLGDARRAVYDALEAIGAAKDGLGRT